jgi:hypothetical protein
MPKQSRQKSNRYIFLETLHKIKSEYKDKDCYLA